MYAGSDDKLQIARCHAIYLLLISISYSLENDGKFGFRSGKKVPAADLKKRLDELGVDPNRLIELVSFFDWSKT